MYKLEVENKYGERMALTGNAAYEITQIDGLAPPDAVVNTTHITGSDGAVFNSAYVDTRQIILNISINGPDAEANRLALYRFFVAKYPVTLRYQNERRSVKISGYVKQMPIEFFGKKQTVQVTIICPEPFFKMEDEVVTSLVYVDPAFELPVEFPDEGVEFSTRTEHADAVIDNPGDMEVGVMIAVEIGAPIERPKFTNLTTGEFFEIDGTISSGVLEISTVPGNKSVTLTDQSNTVNLLGRVTPESSWLTVVPGSNIIAYNGAMAAEWLDVTFSPQFEGV